MICPWCVLLPASQLGWGPANPSPPCNGWAVMGNRWMFRFFSQSKGSAYPLCILINCVSALWYLDRDVFYWQLHSLYSHTVSLGFNNAWADLFCLSILILLCLILTDCIYSTVSVSFCRRVPLCRYVAMVTSCEEAVIQQASIRRWRMRETNWREGLECVFGK